MQEVGQLSFCDPTEAAEGLFSRRGNEGSEASGYKTRPQAVWREETLDGKQTDSVRIYLHPEC